MACIQERNDPLVRDVIYTVRETTHVFLYKKTLSVNSEGQNDFYH